MPFLMAASAVPALSIELSTVVSAAAIAITVPLRGMAGLALQVLRREITHNDEAHRELKAEIADARQGAEGGHQAVEADVKAVEVNVALLLAGQARIEGLLEGMVGGGPHRG